MMSHNPPATPPSASRRSGSGGARRPGGSAAVAFMPLDEYNNDDDSNYDAFESPLAARIGSLSLGGGTGSAQQHHQHPSMRATDGESTAISHNGMLPTGRGVTLREQERTIDALKKENYELKMRIYFLQERLESMAPMHMNEALKDNVELKVALHRLQGEATVLRKSLAAAEDTASPEAVARAREAETRLTSQLTTATEHADTLEIQLLSTREAKLAVEDELTAAREELARVKADRDVARADISAARTEAQFAKAQVAALRDQLLDAGVAAGRNNGDPNSSSRRRSRRESDDAAASDAASGGRDSRRLANVQQQLAHTQAQVAAQNLIIAARESDLDRATRRVATLVAELDSMQREVEMHQAGAGIDPALLDSLARDPNKAEALRVQLGEMHRQLSERATEATTLRRELEGKQRAHDGAVQGLMDAWTKDQTALKAQLAEVQRRAREVECELAETRAELRDAAKARDAAVAKLNRTGRDHDKDSAQRDAALALTGREVDRLEQLVRARNADVAALQQEIASRVRSEADLRDELASVRERVGAAALGTRETRAEAAELEADLVRTQQAMREAEAKWRDEVAARCATEARELQRVADLDAALRGATARATELERQLTDARSELDAAGERRDADAAAAADAAARAAVTERHRDADEYRRQVALLDKAAADARRHARKMGEQLAARDKDLADVHTQLAKFQTDADAHHAKLTKLAGDAHADAARLRAVARGGSEDAVGSPAEAEARIASLAKDNADLVEQVRRARIQAERLEHEAAHPGRETLFKLYTRLSTLLGHGMEGVTSETPVAALEEHILHRIAQLAHLRAGFASRVRSADDHWAAQFNLFLGKLDRKMAQMERAESAIRTVTSQVRALKDQVGRLAAQLSESEARRATAEAQNLRLRAKLEAVTTARGGSSTNGSDTEDVARWQTRARDLDERLRATEDRARGERHSARQKVEQLVHTIRDLERQVEAAQQAHAEDQDLLRLQRQKLEAALNAPTAVRTSIRFTLKIQMGLKSNNDRIGCLSAFARRLHCSSSKRASYRDPVHAYAFCPNAAF
ncbi:hypothetical protein BC828DRAFT_13863 [Blastocladiella britannica]|nr:hypothetical protein BC828DRAFT_13863 [Blastocladiella britannica]